jgi:hypothetical protein
MGQMCATGLNGFTRAATSGAPRLSLINDVAKSERRGQSLLDIGRENVCR